MAIFYLDTSAILKRYRTEKGSAVIDDLYNQQAEHDALLTSHFSCLELESVAIRAVKGKLLTREAYNSLLGGLARDIGEYLLVTSFSPDQLTEAIHFARAHALRAADAMQFAAAIDANRTVIGGAFVFVVSDKELLSAARASNMSTLDPEADDAMEWLRDLRLREGRTAE
jgi:predicted nucleic acid-binding protein